MDECKCCQCGNDAFWYLLSGEIRCTKCLKTYPNEFAEQIAALAEKVTENRRLNIMLNHIAEEIHGIAQAAIKEEKDNFLPPHYLDAESPPVWKEFINILHPEPLGEVFQRVLREVPYEEESDFGPVNLNNVEPNIKKWEGGKP